MDVVATSMLSAWLILVSVSAGTWWFTTRGHRQRKKVPLQKPVLAAALGPTSDERIQEQTLIYLVGNSAVREPTLRGKILYWDHVCVDTTFYALHCLRRCNDLGKSSSALRFIDENRRAIEDFILRCFDEEEGGFRLNEQNWVTIYSVSSGLNALRLLSDRYEPGKPWWKCQPEHSAKLSRDRIWKFVLGCQHSTGGLGERPNWSPSLADTHAGFHSIMWNLWYDDERADEIKKQCLSQARAFISRCWKSNDEKKLHGFSDRPGGQSLSCATSFALASAYGLGGWPAVKQYVGPSLDYFKGCLSHGGFAPEPEQEPTASHTWLVLRTIHEVYFSDEVQDKVRQIRHSVESSVHRPDIVNYVASLLASEGNCGFTTTSPPNVYSTRSAIQALALVQRIWKDDIKIEGIDWKKIEDFIVSLFDRDVGGFRGYLV